MRFGSLFSGVGGFDLGLERAGMECAWTVEYDKQARSVLRKHWPDVPHYEDVHNVRVSRKLVSERDNRGDSEVLTGGGERELSRSGGGHGPTDDKYPQPVDLICGGFPCQDYSVAGKRSGLVGDRGALWWQMHRIIAECRPEWVVGENVPGLLSSNGGRDFLTIIASLVELGYGVTWATLDSQYFGVAQRRRRLFIVGHSGGIPRPEILALGEGLRGHPAPSREAGQGVAGFTPSSFGGYREGAGTLRATDIETGGGNHVVAQYLTARDHKGPNPAKGVGAVVVQPVAFTSDSVHIEGTHEDGTHHPLRASNPPAIYRKAQKAHDPEDCERWEEAEVSGTLATHSTTTGKIAIANCLTARDAKGPLPSRGLGNVVHQPRPRRLTPVECERLQGFPDGWTSKGITDEGDHKELADGPRYRMMGNAVTVNVAEWIGGRLPSEEV